LESPGIIGTEWPGDDEHPAGTVALFQLHQGLILSLYLRSDLAKDARLAVSSPAFSAFSIGHAVATKEEVDSVLAAAQAAGATVTDKPHDRPWGIYSGYFRDLDGHLWEIIWNPALEDI
jgi:uncharacterized glyoxalase superfamily protein PhnB